MTENGNSDTPRGKRKKASRACGHCQKAHLTCDDMRPCSRCVKRDLAATCADGVRKKAKYLQDVDDEVVNASASGTSTPPQSHQHPEPQSQSQQQQPQQQPPTQEAPISVQQQSLQHARLQPQPQPTHTHVAQVAPMHVNPAAVQGEAHPIAPANGLLNYPLASNFEFGSKATSLEYSFLSNMLGAPSGDFALPDMGLGQVGLASVDNVNQPSQTHHGSRESLGTTNSPVAAQDAGHAARASGVYKSVVRPYDYREGFHNLVKYVKERMEKNDIIRICRALAGFRPSFMAQIMNLSEEDLLFMEKCFQRTIMEFDKLIGFSGTPTVVWRRTGEIALVGKEFSILTQWPREQLLGKRTYIYELMDNSSAVDYWEKFSLIAFDNSQQSMMTTCTVLTPTGRPVTCAFCFTIKRDIFDVPLAIVGNFLPLFRAV